MIATPEPCVIVPDVCPVRWVVRRRGDVWWLDREVLDGDGQILRSAQWKAFETLSAAIEAMHERAGQ